MPGNPVTGLLVSAGAVRGPRHAGAGCVICGWRGCLLCCVTVAAGIVPDSEGAEVPLRDVLAAALDANRELARLTAELRAENARLRQENELLRAENAEQAAELEKLRADLAVLHRVGVGGSAERPGPGGGRGGGAGGGPARRGGR